MKHRPVNDPFEFSRNNFCYQAILLCFIHSHVLSRRKELYLLVECLPPHILHLHLKW